MTDPGEWYRWEIAGVDDGEGVWHVWGFGRPLSLDGQGGGQRDREVVWRVWVYDDPPARTIIVVEIIR